ncbi:hypothetical protein NPIL_531021 [Nephila pilipes]|uniref:Uncharacterized protein n=1 Tax=Nephila pilipes TaxID=299642 RepID=A0A8X6TVQ7_NEPPI|nr:hypothetical protein NPIL_531021 [Nephila pilipes]
MDPMNDIVIVRCVFQELEVSEVSSRRGEIRKILSDMYEIPNEDLILMEYNTMNPRALSLKDIENGMVIRIEHAGVTIDPPIPSL